MKTLAIDTTGEEKSAALAVDGQLLTEFSFSGDLFREFWPRLEGFLKANRVKIKEIDCFAVNTGPGSWTGLRFGIAAVKGWALAAGRNVFGLPAGELSLLVRPGHTAAATLACRCNGGVNPENLKLVYGSLPKFRKLKVGARFIAPAGSINRTPTS